MVFIVIQDIEYSMLYDDQPTNFSSWKSVYKTFDMSSRTQEFEKIIFGLNNPYTSELIKLHILNIPINFIKLRNYFLMNYKSIEEIKEENSRIGEIVDQVWRIIMPSSHHSVPSIESVIKSITTKSDKTSANTIVKKGSEVEYDKALSQPFNYEYFWPITGDFVSVFAENMIQASTKKHNSLK